MLFTSKTRRHGLLRWVSTLAALTLPWGGATAQESPVLLAQLNTPNPPSGAFVLRPFKYVPSAQEQSKDTGNTDASDTKSPPRPAAQQRIVDLQSEGQFAAAGKEGRALLAQDPKVDDGLRLIIANSLAWSGQLRDATQTYQSITSPEVLGDAQVGIANVLRWKGRDEQADPLYRDVLTQQPDHVDARNGLELAERELAPRTTITVGSANDSAQALQQSATVGHRWRDESGFHVFEVEAGYTHENQLTVGPEDTLRDVTLRYQNKGLDLKPALELNTPTHGTQRLYGNLRLSALDDQLQLTLGQVNWGKLANNSNVLTAGLYATQAGASGKVETDYGELFGRLDYYYISDTNAIVTSDVRLTSNLRPLGPHIKPILGVETRKASFLTGNYWSPVDGYGSVYGGFQGEWGHDDWSLYGTALVGLALYGDAGTSWSLSGGAKRWVTRDLALSINLWGMSSWRNSSEYRAETISVALEKVWR